MKGRRAFGALATKSGAQKVEDQLIAGPEADVRIGSCGDPRRTAGLIASSRSRASLGCRLVAESGLTVQKMCRGILP
jgi:hypothetical protein